jgi:hypothetical protein
MTATVSAAKRKANNKWDGENMTIIGCKVKKELAARFKEECKARGTTPNEVFRNTVLDFIGETE